VGGRCSAPTLGRCGAALHVRASALVQRLLQRNEPSVFSIELLKYQQQRLYCQRCEENLDAGA